LYYQERIAALNSRLQNFEVLYTVSRPHDEWDGAQGRVTAHLDDLSLTAQYFVCGSGAVINDVCAHLEENGVPKESLFHENFG